MTTARSTWKAGVATPLTIGRELTIGPPCPADLAEKLVDTFTMVNPKWTENDRAGRWNGNTPRTLDLSLLRPDGSLAVPRGALGLVIWLIRSMGYSWKLIDHRRTLDEVAFEFNGSLRPYQQNAVDELLQRDFGLLHAPTGAGKTVVALAAIAVRRQPALIVVHTRELLDQWVQRAETFLGLSRDEIGIVGGGRLELGRPLTVATVQTLYKVAGDVVPTIGHLVVDECHRCPARTFTEAVTAFDCRCMLGLSATPWRRDGLTRLIGWYLGRKVEIAREDLTDDDLVFDIEVVERPTVFDTDLDASEEYVQVLSELTRDAGRNATIAADVVAEASGTAGVCLVLSDRKAHCEDLRDRIQRRGCRADLLTGDLANGRRQAVVERVRAGEVPVVVATAQLIGEGFDAASLSALFLTTPMTFSGRVLQSLGRILRPAPGKAGAKVFDYVDVNVGVLAAAGRKRRRVYRELGATTQTTTAEAR